MKNSLISVIIPVYNVEKYIDRCLNSVLNQTYRNIEIILVDDGSTDLSGNICDKYEKKDDRIVVFHKKNGGLSDARNYGLDRMNGEYVTFIDSDDMVCDNYIEYLYNLIKKYNSNMSICKYKVMSENDLSGINNYKNNEREECVFDKIEALKHLLVEDKFTVSSCAKLYKSILFNGVKFPKGKLCEDNGTTYKLIEKCNTIAYGEEEKYIYIKRSGSITTTKFSEKKLDLIELTDEMCDSLSKYIELKEEILKKRIASRFSILSQLANVNLLNSNIAKEIIEYIKENKKFIFKSKTVTKREKIATLFLIINKNLYKYMWRFYETIKYRGSL